MAAQICSVGSYAEMIRNLVTLLENMNTDNHVVLERTLRQLENDLKWINDALPGQAGNHQVDKVDSSSKFAKQFRELSEKVSLSCKNVLSHAKTLDDAAAAMRDARNTAIASDPISSEEVEKCVELSVVVLGIARLYSTRFDEFIKCLDAELSKSKALLGECENALKNAKNLVLNAKMKYYVTSGALGISALTIASHITDDDTSLAIRAVGTAAAIAVGVIGNKIVAELSEKVDDLVKSLNLIEQCSANLKKMSSRVKEQFKANQSMLSALDGLIKTRRTWESQLTAIEAKLRTREEQMRAQEEREDEVDDGFI